MLNMFKDEKGGEKEGVGGEEKKKGEKNKKSFCKELDRKLQPKI